MSMGCIPSPLVAWALAVLVGACGEAFARDQHEHFVMKFAQPKENEVQTWALQHDVPSHKRFPPANLKPGDLLECIYLNTGRIQLKLNNEIILNFDVERPIDNDADYYAVVDVCLSACSLTVMPPAQREKKRMHTQKSEISNSAISTEASLPECHFPQCVGDEGRVEEEDEAEDNLYEDTAFDSSGSDDGLPCPSLEPSDLSAVVDEFLVKEGIREAVRECKFMVTIADPRGKDCPLVAVSDEFESMTGFTKSETLGANCRFLNQGCDMDPSDLANLRMSSETGVPFTAVVPNRKKSGELFLNLLDIRGLSVARNPVSKEELWFLIGIQADVTDLAEDGIARADHIAELQVVADAIRAGISKAVSRMAVEGAGKSESETSPRKSNCSWRLLREPSWMHESSLGKRHPSDSPAANALAPGVSKQSTSMKQGPVETTAGQSCSCDAIASPRPSSTNVEQSAMFTSKSSIQPAGQVVLSRWSATVLGIGLAVTCACCLSQPRRL